jgi:hypothetical protein
MWNCKVTKWQEQIVRQLIKAGALGVRQATLYQGMDQVTYLHEVVQFLESLRAEHAVQRFRTDKGYVWRVTALIHDVV